MSSVNEIRYVGYGVKDIEAEEKFYTETWGLRRVSDADGMVYLATEGHDELFVARLRQADENRIDVIGLAADTDADVDAIHARAISMDCKIIHAPKKFDRFGGGYGFRLFSPDGLTIEVSSGVARGDARQMERWEAKPTKISHIVLQSPKHKETLQWFIDVLGFRLTDWIGEFMGFLRCNEWHHRIACLPGPPALNHVAYDMLSVDDMMRATARVKRAAFEIKWGPGRHTVGDNTFCYFETPGGSIVEYTSDLEEVDHENHQPQVYKPDMDLMERWGIAEGHPKDAAPHHPDAGLFVAVDR